MSDKGYFKLYKVTNFNEIIDQFEKGEDITLPESDLCFQNENHILQFEFEEPEDDTKLDIKPGIYDLIKTNAGVRSVKTDFRDYNLLDTIDNTSKIIGQAELFFRKLHVYDDLKLPKKRGVLLASDPGMGKTSAIGKVSKELVGKDSGTVIFNWPTSQIDAGDMTIFLTKISQFTSECTRLVLIMEDIGGGEADGYSSRRDVDSDMLNLLDGVGVTFKLPTFIIATTNHPQNLVEALANRPGRFDLVVELKPPSHDERISLFEFISKRSTTDEEKKALGKKGTEKFSIAHIEETVIRSLLNDISVGQAVDELVKHFEKFENSFIETGRGVGLTR